MAFPFKLPESYLAHNPYLQRAWWHDYTDRCMYLITFTSNPVWGPLSRIFPVTTFRGLKVLWCAYAPGKAVVSAVRRLQHRFPWVEMINYTVMPDHIHLLIYVRQKTYVHLNQIMDGFVEECNLPLWYSNNAMFGTSLFNPGYNDRIVMRNNQLPVFKQYVSDNPYRYYIRKQYPEFFRRCNDFNIDGERFTAYGNFLLLKKPEMSAVRISRKFSHQELTARYSQWTEIIRGKGVLVSPFYSRNEKTVRDAGIQNGANLIKVVSNGLQDRFKPYGKDFNLCSQGRLLLIAPPIHNSTKVKLTREMCLRGNEIAEKIAAGVFDARLIDAFCQRND